MTAKQFHDALEKILTKKCTECGADLPRYPNYRHDRLDSRGYKEVWICEKCGKFNEFED